MTGFALALLRLFGHLPPRLTAAVGEAIGALLFRFARERRHVTLTNLRLCLPELDERERGELARAHFRRFVRAVLDRGYAWHWPAERLREWVRLEGMEHLNAQHGKPVILLVPHFVGLDMGWTRLTLERDMVSIYSNQKNPRFNAALLEGRLRFGHQRLHSRQEGIRPPIQSLKSGRPFYYLPDMDYGPKDTIFVPFFGVQAATVTGLSRVARMTGARVLPCITRMLPDGAGYVVSIGAPLAGFPGESVEADTLAMNRLLEAQVRQMPEQYFWAHKRFKTRPPGEPRLY